MKIYDISQELLGSVVYPGDPAPESRMLARIADGAFCNVTALSMCAHNGTHVDAPRHFIEGGKAIDEIPVSTWVGSAYVCHFDGQVGREEIKHILEKARAIDPECAKRLLVGGKATLTEEGALALAEEGVLMYGNESQTVGPEDAPMKTHLILLGCGTVLLEGVRLAGVPCGGYLLSAPPINIKGADGSPCRAVLVDLKN